MQVVKLLEGAYGSWSFDAFNLSELTGGHPLSSLLYFLVARCSAAASLQLTSLTTLTTLSTISSAADEPSSSLLPSSWLLSRFL
jgi:hypothetical protein